MIVKAGLARRLGLTAVMTAALSVPFFAWIVWMDYTIAYLPTPLFELTFALLFVLWIIPAVIGIALIKPALNGEMSAAILTIAAAAITHYTIYRTFRAVLS